MEKVEADLTRSKSLREKQSKEFLWQLDDVKQRYEQQVRQPRGPEAARAQALQQGKSQHSNWRVAPAHCN